MLPAFEQPEIVVLGSASLDIKGRLRSEMRAGTSNPASIHISVGGVARNIAENLARLGAETALIAVIGADASGETIVAHTSAAGVDTTRVLMLDDRSASYLALLGPDGRLLLALDDSQSARLITPEVLAPHTDLIRRARFVVIDANISRVAARYICDLCAEAGVPIGFEPVAFGLAGRYRELLSNFSLVTPNALEAEALTGIQVQTIGDATAAAQQLVSSGVQLAIVTLEGEGLVYATPAEHGHVPAIACEIVDPTGAGDALAAAVIYSLLENVPVDEAVRLGVSAATLTLQSADTVRPDLNLESLYARLVI